MPGPGGCALAHHIPEPARRARARIAQDSAQAMRSRPCSGRSNPSPLLARRRGARVRGTRVRRGSCGGRVPCRGRSSRVARRRGGGVAWRRSCLLGRWERIRRRRGAGRLLLRASRDQQERAHAQKQSTAIHRVTSLFGLRFPGHGLTSGRSVLTRTPVKRSDTAIRVSFMAEK